MLTDADEWKNHYTKSTALQYIKYPVSVLCVLILLFGAVSCSLFSREPQYKKYSEIIDEAYSDKSEIEPVVTGSHGVYQKTVAGILTALDNRDVEGIRRLCCNYLLGMDGTDAAITELVNGFRGHIIDTTYIDSDFYARESALFSDHPQAYYQSRFCVFTDEQAYCVLLGRFSVNEAIEDGDDFVGVTCIRFLSLDREFNLRRLADVLEDDMGQYYLDHYTFADGNTMDVVQRRGCYLSVSYGDSTGYTTSGWEINRTGFRIFQLTGTTDSISRNELEAIDYTDADSAYEAIMSHEPYAVGEISIVSKSPTEYYFNLADSDEKIYFHVLGNPADNDLEIYTVRIVADTMIMAKDDEFIYERES